MSEEALEAAVREHAPSWWTPREVKQVVLYVLEDRPTADREDVANEMWSLGGGTEHAGCPYGGEEPADADYQNECDTCQEALLAAADTILAAVNPRNGGTA